MWKFCLLQIFSHFWGFVEKWWWKRLRVVGRNLGDGDPRGWESGKAEGSQGQAEMTSLTFLLFSFKERQKRQVTHFQFLSWPDYGVPSSAAALIDFLRVVRNQQRLAVSMGARSRGQCPEPPIVVHCSAGIGRTGNAPGGALRASRGSKGGGE